MILLHDGSHEGMGVDRSQTVIVTDRLIRRYKDEGYQFVSVPEMMERQPSVSSRQSSDGNSVVGR